MTDNIRLLAIRAVSDPSSIALSEIVLIAQGLLSSRGHAMSPYRKENLEKAILLRRSGKSFLKIASEIGEGAAGGWLKVLERVGESGEPDHRKKWSEDERRQLKHLYLIGTTAADLADRFGLTEKAVHGQLYRMGVNRK